MFLGCGFETLLNSFQSQAFFVQELALMVELFAPGCSPTVRAKARFGASAKGEWHICRQLVCSARFGRISLDTGVTIIVVGALAVRSLTVSQLVFVVGVSEGPVLADMTAAPSGEIAF